MQERMDAIFACPVPYPAEETITANLVKRCEPEDIVAELLSGLLQVLQSLSSHCGNKHTKERRSEAILVSAGLAIGCGSSVVDEEQPI